MVGPGQRPSQSDFSGEWALVNSTLATPAAAPALSVRQPIVSTTARGTPMPPMFSQLIVERHYTSGDRSETFMIGVQGGSFSGTSRSNTPRVETRQSVEWVGATLVIATSHQSEQSGEMRVDSEHTEVWQLDPQGRLVIGMTDRQGAAESKTTTLTYRRREPPQI